MASNVVFDALKKTFSQRISFLYFFLGSIVMISLYTYVPIFITPGNDLKFFLEITPWWALLVIGILGLFMGVLIAMQIYVWKNLRKVNVSGISAGVGAGFSSLIAGLFSTATCAVCVSALFSFFLPAAGIIFLLEKRWWFVGGGFVLVGLSLYFTSKRVVGKCTSCDVKK